VTAVVSALMFFPPAVGGAAAPAPAGASSPAPAGAGAGMLEAASVTAQTVAAAPPAQAGTATRAGTAGTGKGYWLAGADGQVYPFGDALQVPPLARGALGVDVVVGVAVAPSGRGLWLATLGGRVLRVGDAPAVGDLAGKPGLPAIRAIAVLPTPASTTLTVRSTAPGTVTAGNTFDTTITVANTGLVAARAVRASDVPPDRGDFVSSTAPGGGYGMNAKS